jgi:DnaJ-class molecular chaperone
VHQLRGEGMPIPDDGVEVKSVSAMARGDMFIKFDIHFPTNVTVEQRSKILALLKQNAAETDS